MIAADSASSRTAKWFVTTVIRRRDSLSPPARGVGCEERALRARGGDRQRRSEAESRRLFYVQITRARDQLVLVGRDRKFLREVIQPAALWLEPRGLLRRVAAATRPAQALPDAPMAPPVVPAGRDEQSPFAVRGHARQLSLAATQLEDFWLCPRRFRARHVLQLPEHPLSDAFDGADSDARIRGTLAHRVLEKLNVQAAAHDPDGALSAALDRALAGTRATTHEEIRWRVAPFVRGACLREWASRASRIEREVPFALSVEGCEPRLLVRGQIDVVVHAGDSVDVIDYKVSKPRGGEATEPHAFQLAVYAEAVQRAVGTGVRVRAGVQFLDGTSSEPCYRAAPAVDVAAVLGGVARDLEHARRTNVFAGRPRTHCERIGCGYLGLCHGPVEERGESV